MLDVLIFAVMQDVIYDLLAGGEKRVPQRGPDPLTGEQKTIVKVRIRAKRDESV